MPTKKTSAAEIPDDLIQLVQCDVAMGEEHRTIVRRGIRNPVTYPEVLVLEKLHLQPGKPEAVRNVKHLGYVRRSTAQEKRRLVQTYGAAVVEDVYPGRSPAMERVVPDSKFTPAPGKNCLIGDFVGETIEVDAPNDPAIVAPQA